MARLRVWPKAMNGFTGKNTGRVHLMHLTLGDDIIPCIEAECQRLNLQTGIVMSGIGSLRKATFHYTNANTEKPEDVFVTLDKTMEVVALQGIILEGKPHLHVQLSANGSECYGGHMEEGCEVQYLVELAILEVADLPLGRRAGAYGTVTHFEWLK